MNNLYIKRYLTKFTWPSNIGQGCIYLKYREYIYQRVNIRSQFNISNSYEILSMSYYRVLFQGTLQGEYVKVNKR